jgi:hypothetical protein
LKKEEVEEECPSALERVGVPLSCATLFMVERSRLIVRSSRTFRVSRSAAGRLIDSPAYGRFRH